jgi:hypothetical protein
MPALVCLLSTEGPLMRAFLPHQVPTRKDRSGSIWRVRQAVGECLLCAHSRRSWDRSRGATQGRFRLFDHLVRRPKSAPMSREMRMRNGSSIAATRASQHEPISTAPPSSNATKDVADCLSAKCSSCQPALGCLPETSHSRPRTKGSRNVSHFARASGAEVRERSLGEPIEPA